MGFGGGKPGLGDQDLTRRPTVKTDENREPIINTHSLPNNPTRAFLPSWLNKKPPHHHTPLFPPTPILPPTYQTVQFTTYNKKTPYRPYSKHFEGQKASSGTGKKKSPARFSSLVELKKPPLVHKYCQK